MANLSCSDILIRLALAFGAGFVIGWERESHGRPAGLRTNILACLAAAIAMIISENFSLHFALLNGNGIRADPARLGAGVLTGIGFLGGGTILRHENMIRGVTTAASLWIVTILGLAFGSGLYLLGGLGVGFAMAALFVLSLLEKRLHADWYATLTVVLLLDSKADQTLRAEVETLGPKVQTMKLHYELVKKQKTITCDLKLERLDRFEAAQRVVRQLTEIPGILEVKWN
jgi:putative Mg2+ transporter-C (MgtC) family protein